MNSYNICYNIALYLLLYGKFLIFQFAYYVYLICMCYTVIKGKDEVTAEYRYTIIIKTILKNF